MTAALVQIVASIQMQRPLKWHWGIIHFARLLKISVEEANGFISLIEKSKTGNKKFRSWKSKSEPFVAKIDLT